VTVLGQDTWTGNTSNVWETPGNWSAGVPVSGTTATFNSSGGNRGISLGATESIGALAIDSSNPYTFSGSQITLNNTGAGSAALAVNNLSTTGSGSNTVTFNNNIHFSGASPYIDIRASGASSTASTNVTFAGNISSTGNLSTVSRSSNVGSVSVTISGNYTSANQITWDNPASLTLSGSNSFTNLTLLRSTVLNLASNAALANGSTLVCNTTAGSPGIGLQVAAAGANRSYAANITFNAASGYSTSFTGSHTLTFTGTTTLQRANDITNPYNNAIDVSAPRLELTGNWSGGSTIGMRKEGAGILVMGANRTTTATYGNATVINAGTMLVNGDLSNNTSVTTDIVTVNNSSTLGGTGIIERDTTIGATAFLAPGDGGAGKLSFKNVNLTLAGTLRTELGGKGVGQYDVLDLSGTGVWNFTGSTLAISLINGFDSSIALGDQFTILTSTQNLTTGFWGGSVTSGAYQFSINYHTNDVTLITTAVPESSSVIMVFLGLSLTFSIGFIRKNINKVSSRFG